MILWSVLIAFINKNDEPVFYCYVPIKLSGNSEEPLQKVINLTEGGEKVSRKRRQSFLLE